MDLDDETLELLGGGREWEVQVPKWVLQAHLRFLHTPAVYTKDERKERHRKAALESYHRRRAHINENKRQRYKTDLQYRLKAIQSTLNAIRKRKSNHEIHRLRP